MSNDFAFSPSVAAPGSPMLDCRQGRATPKASQCLPAPRGREERWRCPHLPPTRHSFKAFTVHNVGLGFSSWGHVGKHPYVAALAPHVLGCDNGEGAVRWCWPAEGLRAPFPIAVSPFYEVVSYLCSETLLADARGEKIAWCLEVLGICCAVMVSFSPSQGRRCDAPHPLLQHCPCCSAPGAEAAVGRERIAGGLANVG